MATEVVLTNEGRQILTHRLRGDSGWTTPEYIGWGTGEGVASEDRTQLYAEAPESRVLGTTSIITDQKPDDTFRVVGALTATGARNITNAGVFDVSDKTDANDRLFIHASFDAIPLNEDDSIQFTFNYRQN